MGIPELEDPGSLPTRFEVKGTRCRWNLVEMDASAGYRLYDAKARRLFTVFPKLRSVTVADLPPVSGPHAGGRGVWSFSHIDAGWIAGYPCERLRARDATGTRTYDLCATRELSTIPLAYAVANASARLPFLADLEARGELPLAVTTRDGPSGEPLDFPSSELMTLEVERVPLDDSRFVLPDFPVTAGRVSLPAAR